MVSLSLEPHWPSIIVLIVCALILVLLPKN